LTSYPEISFLPAGAALLDRHPPPFSTAVSIETRIIEALKFWDANL
jgi:hypothetical protein